CGHAGIGGGINAAITYSETKSLPTSGVSNSVGVTVGGGVGGHFAYTYVGVVCGRGRNPTLRLWPTIFSGKIDVFPGDRRSRLISSMTSVAPA
ncbi:hypothetical protein FUV59_23665, partial [Escherichia coli]|nr:hypothetical protein [Escherichia coli]